MNKKSITITSIGTFLEWYEFGIFGYLTTYLAADFFPEGDRMLAMIYVFGIFGFAYITRPLGGLIFGYIGDRYGRKKAIVISSLVIALTMLFTGCLPTFREIGITATLLLIFNRIIQGVSVGGEYSGTLVSLVEQANESTLRCRGFVGSIGAFTSNIGFFSSAFIISIICFFIPKDDMITWGWRIPFFIGFAVGIIFFFLRTTIDESKVYKDLSANKAASFMPIKLIFSQYKKEFLVVLLINLYISILYSSIFIFLPHLSKIRNNSLKIEFIICLLLLLFSCFLLLSGYISDLLGRKKTIVLFSAIISASAIFISFIPSISALLIISILGILLAFPLNAVNILSTEFFPTQCRYTGLGVSFNLANIAGGFTPMLLLITYKYTHNLSIITLIIAVLSLLLLLTVHFFISETAFKDLA